MKASPLFVVLGLSAGLWFAGSISEGPCTQSVMLMMGGGFLAMIGLAIACFGIASGLWDNR